MGVEYFGSRSQLADVEIIDMAATFLRKLGLHDKVELNINTLGDSASRSNYRSILTEYLQKYKNDLSDDSIRR
jgi:histidyl-tRNA synthetase